MIESPNSRRDKSSSNVREASNLAIIISVFFLKGEIFLTTMNNVLCHDEKYYLPQSMMNDFLCHNETYSLSFALMRSMLCLSERYYL